MDTKLVLVLAFLSVHVVSSPFGLVHGSTTMSPCSQAPYPELCNSLIGTKPLGTPDETQFDLRKSAIRVTLNQAQQAYSLVSSMDVSSFDKRAKLAWADCLELYDDTVYQLNRSINSKDQTSAQTWLSAAITNQQTCKNGFIDLNLSSHLESFPVNMLSDLSKLLGNSLALNKATSSISSNFAKMTRNRRLLADGFPEWVSSADRKLLQSSSPSADIVVAQDGSGNYKTISEAVAASNGGTNRFVIYIKAGVYNENVVIKRSMKNLMFIGDGIDATIVTGNKNNQAGSTTFRSATVGVPCDTGGAGGSQSLGVLNITLVVLASINEVGVSGDGFIARDMTFENTAGPQKHQAVALRSSSDHSVFYSCSFKGYQDTLYVYALRQFFRNCNVYGTVDFIFGNAVVVFQSCNIYVRKPMSNQQNTVTAQGRTDPNQNTGIVIHNSIVTASSDMKPVQGSFKTYLGRPWHKYSRTVFMKCTLDSLINPAGWAPWSGSFLSTLYYGEYMNTGAGASTGGRVKWPGYHVITSPTEAGKFTVGNFLGGDGWIPASGVPYTAGL
ncbi:unnamed protein product [Camellia sinensis]